MQNPYQLAFPSRFKLALSVYEFHIEEALDRPYQLTISVTMAERDLALARLIGQPVTFTIAPQLSTPALAIPGLATLQTNPEGERCWHGVIRHAQRGRSTAEETLYTFEISPRIALLEDGQTTRLFQNATVAQVIEALLRKHALDGTDFSFNLTGVQASYEHITQFRETDLAFLSRIAAHAGIFYQFTQAKDGKEVIQFGNNLEHYCRGNLNDIELKEHTGLESVGTEAITELTIRHRPMLKTTRRRNFNDMTASTPLDGTAGFSVDVPAAYGEDYEWGDGNRDKDESDRVAQLRHQLSVSRQCIASGKGNVCRLRPGEVLRLTRPFADAPYGWLITAVIHRGRRDQAYENTFEAIPSDRIWRPALLPKPRIHSTLPAMVVSPGNNSYQYPFIDEHGRYRVRYLFDLDKWSPGGDSRAVRLAKPFAGGQFGFHMPIHAGTIVNLAFSDGDPDAPYIASITHDSTHPDHITTQWNSRNVIRTKANNKLRMEDLQGKQHIKLATEYGKAQLNIGHLVDATRQQRGEGFEIRTDHWGAIRAGKGLLISAEAKSVAATAQLDMAAALHQLEQANRLAKALADAATTAQALPPDVQAQVDLLQHSLKQLAQAGILMSAPAGIGLTTPQTIQQSAGASYAVTAGQHISHAALGDIRSNANGAISLFARSGGARLYANQGSVDIQAQGGPLAVSAAKALRLNSNQHISVAGHDSIELAAGGHGIRISAKGVEVFGDIKLHGTLSNEGKAGLEHEDDSFPQTDLLPNKGLSL
ncbi:type VI secretion system Vgr family protein [Aquitalea denitrificans]|uniref:type VI secretion system Vgr family protein n=1 Tax=Aquitalea denitrificans TaxID=519081 RepID=UPI00135C55A8|nr:type VI secretion system Vgr family protein [Aquitalea denitrificans]